jgi:WD40 repeat protein
MQIKFLVTVIKLYSIFFSVCGRLIATAGQDNIVRIWVLKSYLNHFTKVREKLNSQTSRATSNSANPELSFAMQDLENAIRNVEDKKSVADTDSLSSSQKSPEDESPIVSANAVFAPKPFIQFRGHTADVLNLSWSRNYFLLSSGMDRTVKLWHLARTECLCCFQHMDFVTCISFMPKVYFNIYSH